MIKILILLLGIFPAFSFSIDRDNSDSALNLIKAVIENQRAVNLVYDAKAVISFHTLDNKLKSRREIISRYNVVEGRIIKGRRLSAKEILHEPSPDDGVPEEVTGESPRYKESNILPLFSPLSDTALPFYTFKITGEEKKNDVETIAVKYQPVELEKDLSFGAIWISKKDTDLVALEMHAVKSFTFTEYFVMRMDYIKEKDIWVPEKINTELLINILGLYKRLVYFDQYVIRRY